MAHVEENTLIINEPKKRGRKPHLNADGLPLTVEEKNNELRGVKVRIDLDGYSSDKAFPTVSANFKNKKLSEIIFSLIKNVGWNYSLKNGTVLIYFPEKKKADVSTNPFENEEPTAGPALTCPENPHANPDWIPGVGPASNWIFESDPELE